MYCVLRIVHCVMYCVFQVSKLIKNIQLIVLGKILTKIIKYPEKALCFFFFFIILHYSTILKIEYLNCKKFSKVKKMKNKFLK